MKALAAIFMLTTALLAQDATTPQQRAALKADADAKAGDLLAAAAGVVEQTNAFRARENRSPVTADDKLTRAAADFAKFMADSNEYGHRADGRAPADRVKAQRYDFCMVSENIAYQFSSRGFDTDELAKNFTQGWIDSPGHRANMLAPEATQTGVAIARSSGGVYYAVQLFARPESMSFSFTISNQSDTPFVYELDGKPYTLDPRSRATHTLCIAAPLKFPDDVQRPKGVAATTEPSAGVTYVVRNARGGRTLLVQAGK